MLKKPLAALVAGAIATASIFFLAPPPQRASAQFVEQSTYGGTSTGSANAQAIVIPNLANRPIGVPFRFIPGFTNTGPTTINDGLGALAVVRPSSVGNVAFSGGEFLAGELTSIVYTGSVYQLASNVDLTPIGRTVEYRGSTTPRGTLIEDGSCVSQTTYAALFSVIGTGYGSCSAGLFALPDSRGTMFAALDTQGANGAANRITSAGSGCAATSPILCGSQTTPLTPALLPTIPVTVSTSSSTMVFGGVATTVTTGGGTGIFGGSSQGPITSSGNSTNAPGGSSVSHPVLNPILLGRRAIKY